MHRGRKARPAISFKPTQRVRVNNWVRGAGGQERCMGSRQRKQLERRRQLCRTRWQPAQLPTISRLITSRETSRLRAGTCET